MEQELRKADGEEGNREGGETDMQTNRHAEEERDRFWYKERRTM